MGPRINYSPTLERLPDQLFSELAVPVRQTVRSASKIWKALIEDYSGRKLSQQADRLPAISGITREPGKLWQGRISSWTMGKFLHWPFRMAPRATDKQSTARVSRSQLVLDLHLGESQSVR
jgi:hypothetical protein